MQKTLISSSPFSTRFQSKLCRCLNFFAAARASLLEPTRATIRARHAFLREKQRNRVRAKGVRERTGYMYRGKLSRGGGGGGGGGELFQLLRGRRGVSVLRGTTCKTIDNTLVTLLPTGIRRWVVAVLPVIMWLLRSWALVQLPPKSVSVGFPSGSQMPEQQPNLRRYFRPVAG